jgi:hypothetical protein
MKAKELERNDVIGFGFWDKTLPQYPNKEKKRGVVGDIHCDGGSNSTPPH